MDPSSAASAVKAADPLGFERVLLPHCSLPSRGFHLLMLGLGLISLAVGIGFVSIGAWPVTGFFGLDVALVYIGFRINYRRARRREILRLAGDAFTVERISAHGSRRVWRFQPFWLRVVLEERDAEFEPPLCRLARPLSRDRRFSGASRPPRARRDDPGGAGTLARCDRPRAGGLTRCRLRVPGRRV